jgi:hypothetical protein
MKIRELLTDKSKWIKGAYAKDKYGDSINESDQDACQWCLDGAGYCCYGIGVWQKEVRPKVCTAIEKLNQQKDAVVVNWNDDPNTTFEDVKKLVEELDI